MESNKDFKFVVNAFKLLEKSMATLVYAYNNRNVVDKCLIERVYTHIKCLARNILIMWIKEHCGEDASMLYENYIGSFETVVGTAEYMKTLGIHEDEIMNYGGGLIYFHIKNINDVMANYINNCDHNIEAVQNCCIHLQQIDQIELSDLMLDLCGDIMVNAYESLQANKSARTRKTFGGKNLDEHINNEILMLDDDIKLVVKTAETVVEQPEILAPAKKKTVVAKQSVVVSKATQKKLNGLYSQLNKAKKSNNAGLINEIQDKINALKKA